MKITLFVLVFFICMTSEAQRPAPIQTNKVTAENVNLKVDPSKIKIADTTNIKLNKLVNEFKIQKEENEHLKQELAVLKTSLNSLTTKTTEMQKDDAAFKLLMVGVNTGLGSVKKITPVAYASFEPEKGSNGGYTFKIASQYGIRGTPVQSYGSVTITLDHSIVGKPVIITSAGEDHVNSNASLKISTILYDFTAPNTIRLSLKEGIAPFSFVVYGTVE